MNKEMVLIELEMIKCYLAEGLYAYEAAISKLLTLQTALKREEKNND